MNFTLLKFIHKFIHLLFKFGRKKFILVVSLIIFSNWFPDSLDFFALRLWDGLDNILGCFIFIFISKIIDIVLDLALRMRNNKFKVGGGFAELENLVSFKSLLKFLKKVGIRGILDRARVIKYSKYSLLLVKQIKYALVISKFNILEALFKSLVDKFCLFIFKYVS